MRALRRALLRWLTMLGEMPPLSRDLATLPAWPQSRSPIAA